MTRTRRILLVVGLGLVVLVVAISAGGSRNEPERTGSSAATTPAATTAPTQPGEEPLSTLPTPERVQTLVFERAFSECASYDLRSLAGKHNVAVESKETVALAVGEAWARQFGAGEDAVADGRDGCLQGFSRR